jgi:hypothetical protein
MTGRMAIGEVDGVEAESQHSFCGLRCCTVGFGLWRSKPKRRWRRVWGRGWRRRKACILAAGRDTAAERWGRDDDRHGR